MSFDPFLRVTKLGLVHHAMSSHAGFYGLKSKKKKKGSADIHPQRQQEDDRDGVFCYQILSPLVIFSFSQNMGTKMAAK